MNDRSGPVKTIALFLGIALLVGTFLAHYFIALSNAQSMLVITMVMALWWVTEAIPLALCSLIPLVFFPLYGIESAKQASTHYINSVIFLFLGGFLLAGAIEKSNLHKRMAVTIISFFGTSAKSLVMGFVLSSWFLSMWISNTATAVMMTALALSVLSGFSQHKDKQYQSLTTALLLGVAYGSSMGGITTIVGTPPNLSFMRIFEISFPHLSMSFTQWLFMVMPISICFLIGLYFLFFHFFFRFPKGFEVIDSSTMENLKKDLGPFSLLEKKVFTVFLMTIFLWIFRKDIDLGVFKIPAWTHLLPFPKGIHDSTVVMMSVFILALLPGQKKGEKILNAQDLLKIPWDMLLLFGGGFALAHGLKISGLAKIIATNLAYFLDFPPVILIGLFSFTITFLTELTSNTATAEMILPLIGDLSKSLSLPPLYLMVPITLSCSCAFMFPVATPPNAIVFATKKISLRRMMKVGLFLNLYGVVLMMVFSFLFE